MTVACWSVKGGVGTTVVACAVALCRSRPGDGPVLIVDLQGDVASALGVAPPSGPGLFDWLGAPATTGVDALGRLEVSVRDGLTLLAPGEHRAVDPDAARLDAFVTWLASQSRGVVIDCGLLRAGTPAARLAEAATSSLLVTEACYLAVRRALELPVQPTGAVVVAEATRALGPADVAEVIGIPVRAVVPRLPEIARAVDAGLLATRLPRSLGRSLRDAA